VFIFCQKGTLALCDVMLLASIIGAELLISCPQEIMNLYLGAGAMFMLYFIWHYCLQQYLTLILESLKTLMILYIKTTF